MSDNQEETIEQLRAELAALRGGVPQPIPPIIVEEPEIKLDLGAGPRPREGYKGVDWIPGVTDYCFNLWSGEKWPFPDNSVSSLHSSHVIEHIDANYIKTYKGEVQDALLFFFDEAYRIAKPGADFTVIWPVLKSDRAFMDPTHRRFIPSATISYLCKSGREQLGVNHYIANSNWIGTVQPTVPAEESVRNQETAAIRHNTLFNVAYDFHAFLKAEK